MYVVLGESLIDMVAGPGGVDQPLPGGAPYNFARALALRGFAAGYANPFSEDFFGQLLRRTLEASGAKHLGNRSSRPTSIARVTSRDGKPHYTFDRGLVADRDLDAAWLAEFVLRHEATGFHTGGLALVPQDAPHAMAMLLGYRMRKTPCTVDVNMRPAVAQSMGATEADCRAAAFRAIEAADIVKVSDEDLAHLDLAGDPVDRARTLLTGACKLVVLTLGAGGAWAITGQESIHQAAAQVDCVDTIGAGDCFFAGFVASLMKNRAWGSGGPPTAQRLEDALRHATACAAFNLARRGCQPPGLEDVPLR
jgi:fructokinase